MGMDDKRMPTCGDCIHADVCERNPLYTEFSRDNPAYCEGFKNKANYTEVVRCKDCKHRGDYGCPMYHEEYIEWDDDEYHEREIIDHDRTRDDGFCDLGERRTDEQNTV